jgi:Ty3 transposon capsid-like protein/Zinc knuckle
VATRSRPQISAFWAGCPPLFIFPLPPHPNFGPARSAGHDSAARAAAQGNFARHEQRANVSNADMENSDESHSNDRNDDSDSVSSNDYKQKNKDLKDKLRTARDKQDLKPKLPNKYDGSAKSSDLENWLASVEMYLEAKGMLNHPKSIPFVATLLTGGAATWWRYHRISARGGEIPEIVEWENFREQITTHFRPEDAERLANEKLQRCIQTYAVRDYNCQRFQLLMVELPSMDQKTRLFSYLTGLKTAVRLQVELQDPKSLKRAMELAEIADSTLYRVQQAKKGYTQSSGKNTNAWTGKRINAIDEPGAKSGTTETRACYYCEKTGHLMRDCKKRQSDKKKGILAPAKGAKGASAPKNHLN